MTSNSILVTSRMSVASLILPSRSCCDKSFSRRIHSGLNVLTPSVDSDCLSTSGHNIILRALGPALVVRNLRVHKLGSTSRHG